MPKMALSDAGLRSIKHPPRGTIDFWDTKLPAFGVRVGTQSITFVLNIDKTRRAIGRYPLISLSDARGEAKRLLAEKTLGKVRPASITLPQAREIFLKEKRAGRRPRTVQDLESRLTRHFPLKGQLQDADHAYIARRLGQIKTNPEHNAALRVARTFFTWAVNRRYISDNPTIGFEFRSTQARARVLSDNELLLIWRACDTSEGQNVKVPSGGQVPLGASLPRHFKTIVKLLILTGMRRSECAALQTSWITEATSAPLLTLPASATKNGREHTLPIGKLALPLLTFSETSSGLLFPARGSNTKPFNGWSKAKAALEKLSGVKDWTLHDLRRTFATNLARLGTPVHITEKLLNHVSGSHGGIVGVYQRHQYEAECREAIEKYDDFIQNLVAQG